MTTALIAKWGVDQLTKSGVSVNLGKDTLQFVKQPNGVFTPPANCTATLTQSSGAYTLQMRHGNKFNFNSSGLLTNIVDQYSQTLNLTYNASNWVSTVKDWKNRTLHLQLHRHAVTLTSVSDGTRTVCYGYSTTYNSQGDLTSFTDAEGKTSTYHYDTNHQITATLDAQSRLVVSNLYDSQGHVTTQYTQGDTNKMWHIFWSGWQTTEFDPAGGEADYFYDDQGRLTACSGSRSATETDTFYDGQNHIIYTISPLNETNQFIYDGNNNLIQKIDPLGFTNQFVYDNQNNLIRTIDPRGNASTFGYNTQFSLTGSDQWRGRFGELCLYHQWRAGRHTGQQDRFRRHDHLRLRFHLRPVKQHHLSQQSRQRKFCQQFVRRRDQPHRRAWLRYHFQLQQSPPVDQFRRADQSCHEDCV